MVVVWIGGVKIWLHDLAFLPSRASFTPHFLAMVVEVNVCIPPHILELVGIVEVSKAYLPVKLLFSTQSFLSKSFLMLVDFMELIRLP